MTPFDQLTGHGKARRLRVLAKRVLEEDYDLADPRIRLVSMHSFNTIYRIDAGGRRFALRVGDACRIHPPGIEATEAAWLAEIRAAGIQAPENIATRDGRRWTVGTTTEVPGERVVTLFTWLDGKVLAPTRDTRVLVRAGRLLAELHEHALTIPLSPPRELHATQAIYFGSGDLVASYQSEHGSLFTDATARVQQLIDELWAQHAKPHLLHGDFGPGNILTWRDQLRPIDFQDLGYGFDVQDLGITITDITRGTPEFVEPFLRGYRQVRELPDLSPTRLATFAAARSLNVMNLALLSPHSGIGAALERHRAHVVSWMTCR